MNGCVIRPDRAGLATMNWLLMWMWWGSLCSSLPTCFVSVQAVLVEAKPTSVTNTGSSSGFGSMVEDLAATLFNTELLVLFHIFLILVGMVMWFGKSRLQKGNTRNPGTFSNTVQTGKGHGTEYKELALQLQLAEEEIQELKKQLENVQHNRTRTCSIFICEKGTVWHAKANCRAARHMQERRPCKFCAKELFEHLA